MYQKYTGIILKKHPFSEADELLTIYTRETGKLRVKARATRKVKSRLSGHLQSLNEISFEVARKSANIPVLISVRLLSLNKYLRENLPKFAWASVGVETLYRLTGDEQENPEAYETLGAFLKALGETRHDSFEVRRFQLRVLALLGHALPLERCQECQQQLTDKICFDTRIAGLICYNCNVKSGLGLALSEVVYPELRNLINDNEPTDLNSETENVVDGFLQHILEREIKSSDFVKTLT